MWRHRNELAITIWYYQKLYTWHSDNQMHKYTASDYLTAIEITYALHKKPKQKTNAKRTESFKYISQFSY